MNRTEPASTFPRLFAEVVAARADHAALIHAGETQTYRDLDQRCARMARAFLASGAGKGTRIAILAPDSALLLTAFYAALRIGALVTPISTLTTPTELAHIVRTSDAQILIGLRRFLSRDFGRNIEAACRLDSANPRRYACPRRLSAVGVARRLRRSALGAFDRGPPGARRRTRRAGYHAAGRRRGRGGAR